MKKVVPFGEKVIGRRVLSKELSGGKLGGEGLIVSTAVVDDQPTGILEIVSLPDFNEVDELLYKESECIKDRLWAEVKTGSAAEARKGLKDQSEYLNIRGLKPGDRVVCGVYAGVPFKIDGNILNVIGPDGERVVDFVVINTSDIIGRIVDDR